MRSKSTGEAGETFLNRARRRQFVTCATEALGELGYTATTVAEVARRAGVSKSVVLYHFSSRAELMEAVVDQLYGDAVEPIHAAVGAAETARERVLAYVRACVLFVWAHQREARAVLEVARNLRKEDGSPRYTAREGAALVGFARGLLEEGQRSGELGDFDAWTLAVLLRATIDNLSEQFMADPALDGPRVADSFAHLVGKMITPREGES
ncbi:TetR/AcrR family transcriptional regulator [Amycolatopsis endophytica]|uniref:AcrR family transcriptional regulator n=1 Tax=Amycolatopsis endophytica TaxID=860233 RepID=A0A853BC08_9PSEU|nr:TetR/AcrR family transcriptional regulator [Amycolatopsis endophytica]NYI92908.1 AcrR family transcriptional regulator [Amycolatopsis endophytica]